MASDPEARDDYPSEAEQVDRFGREVSDLRVRVRALESRFKDGDTRRLREDGAVLKARDESLLRARDGMSERSWHLALMTAGVLVVVPLNLAVTVAAAKP